MTKPIASYRTERGRLVLLVDMGQHGVYHRGGSWVAMRADVALQMVRSRGLGASLRTFQPGTVAGLAGRDSARPWGWRRSPAGQAVAS